MSESLNATDEIVGVELKILGFHILGFWYYNMVFAMPMSLRRRFQRAGFLQAATLCSREQQGSSVEKQISRATRKRPGGR